MKPSPECGRGVTGPRLVESPGARGCEGPGQGWAGQRPISRPSTKATRDRGRGKVFPIWSGSSPSPPLHAKRQLQSRGQQG